MHCCIQQTANSTHPNTYLYLNLIVIEQHKHKHTKSITYRIIFNSNEFLIYTPDENIETSKMYFPRDFTDYVLLNYIRIITFLVLVGPRKTKMPCRHILFVTRRFSIEMFAPRWLKMYQYTFE